SRGVGISIHEKSQRSGPLSIAISLGAFSVSPHCTAAELTQTAGRVAPSCVAPQVSQLVQVQNRVGRHSSGGSSRISPLQAGQGNGVATGADFFPLFLPSAPDETDKTSFVGSSSLGNQDFSSPSGRGFVGFVGSFSPGCGEFSVSRSS